MYSLIPCCRHWKGRDLDTGVGSWCRELPQGEHFCTTGQNHLKYKTLSQHIEGLKVKGNNIYFL